MCETLRTCSVTYLNHISEPSEKGGYAGNRSESEGKVVHRGEEAYLPDLVQSTVMPNDLGH